MELGQKIKQLRYKAGLTQEQLAEKLGLSAQSVSKWENAAAMPDITLLPRLAEEFGVSIDELFDLTREEKLRRIENRLDMDGELPGDIFWEYEEYLKGLLEEGGEQARLKSLLAQLYYHRMEADARRVSRYAREATRLEPGKKDCQWLLIMAEGAAGWDWNFGNHAKTIEFYQELIRQDTEKEPSPLPYYYLIDQLLADHRTKEAREYLKAFAGLPGHKPFMVSVYEAHIALAEYDEKKADAIMEAALEKYGKDSGFLFETAQYYARKCDYEKAVSFYEMSYDQDEKRPRFIDALQGIAMIYEIQGQNRKAAATYTRILEAQKNEWGFQGDEAEMREMERERNRLLQKQDE